MSWIVRSCLALAMAASTSGCLQSKLDETWGRSFDAHIAWQEANPDAPESYEPPENLDPETGKRVAERYYQGQEQQRQRQAPSVVIGDF